MDCFEYFQNIYNKEKPEHRIFFAGIIGYGCNIGIRKISKISKDMKQSVLERTVNCYFSNENLIRANNKILELENKML